MTLTFMRNKVVEVEPLTDGNLSVCWRLVDTFTESEIRTTFRLPELEIVKAEARILRSPHPECLQAPPLLQKVVGVRVGPGVRKIVQGLLGGEIGCDESGPRGSWSPATPSFSISPPPRSGKKERNGRGTEEEISGHAQIQSPFGAQLHRLCRRQPVDGRIESLISPPQRA